MRSAPGLVGNCLAPILILVLSSFPARAEDHASGAPAQGHSTVLQLNSGASIDPSMLKDAQHAIDIAIQWLDAQQHEDGSWSLGAHPAITGLAVMAHELDPRRNSDASLSPAAQKGIDFVLHCVQPDGGIYVPSDLGPSLPHYNTALAMTALILAQDPRYRPTINQAEQLLVAGQHLGDDMFNGGFGYEPDGKRQYADLSSTYMVVEALYNAEKARPPEEARGPGERSLDWQAALQFISRVQNLPGLNDQAWAQNPSKDDLGGFAYHPGESKAGDETAADGSRQLHSYGSMTYAGLLSFIYAKIDRDDPRVQAAVDWVRRHYTVDENPGMGAQGMYYSFHTMAKALTYWGESPLVLADGTLANWRNDLARRLISLQRIDPKTGLGYWVNDNNRWWESDPVLATSYALITMEILLGRNGKS